MCRPTTFTLRTNPYDESNVASLPSISFEDVKLEYISRFHIKHPNLEAGLKTYAAALSSET